MAQRCHLSPLRRSCLSRSLAVSASWGEVSTGVGCFEAALQRRASQSLISPLRPFRISVSSQFNLSITLTCCSICFRPQGESNCSLCGRVCFGTGKPSTAVRSLLILNALQARIEKTADHSGKGMKELALQISTRARWSLGASVCARVSKQTKKTIRASDTVEKQKCDVAKIYVIFSRFTTKDDTLCSSLDSLSNSVERVIFEKLYNKGVREYPCCYLMLCNLPTEFSNYSSKIQLAVSACMIENYAV